MKYLWVLLTIVAAGCLNSCIFDNYSADDCAVEDGINLVLSLQMPFETPSTRAGVGSLPAEQIRDFRVVVVSLPEDAAGNAVPDEEATVEVNERLLNVPRFVSGPEQILVGAVTPDRKKRVYFLLNFDTQNLGLRKSDGTPLDLRDDGLYLPGPNGRAAIDDAVFKAPTGMYGGAGLADYRVPVTAVHEVTVPPLGNVTLVRDENIPGLVYKANEGRPFYLVRAVNKISLTLENATGIKSVDDERVFDIEPVDIRLTEFSISKLDSGESNYVFAHLDENDPLFSGFAADGDLNPAWMKWLKAEADKTQNDQNIDKYEWLTSYRVPAMDRGQDANAERTFTLGSDVSPRIHSSNNRPLSESSFALPAVYFPETHYIPEGDSRQQYLLTCKFEEYDEVNNETVPTTYSTVLPNLESLFRDTHVKINLKYTDAAHVELNLVVLPWYVAAEEEWTYDKTVTIADNGFIKWENAEDDNTETCRLVLKTDGSSAVGTFSIASPVNDEWYAYLIPLTGDPDAFVFTDAQGREIASPHGIIGGSNDDIKIYIKQRTTFTPEQNSAKLQIMVRTADNRFLEADVCAGEPVNYTIIQNQNIF